jgi:hypothetical protein
MNVQRDRRMKARSLKISAIVTAGVLFSSACFGQFFIGPSVPFGAPGAAGALISILVYVIAKHEASERQKKIAEERARQAYARMSAQRRANLKKKKVRYIAVDTEKDAKTSPKAQKSVMVWDTESQKVANPNVYDVKSAPPVGSTAKFDNYSAEYVGSGT